MQHWFTGDTHFGHANVIEYSKRPFESVEAMDEALVTLWNAVVSPKDVVYHLGDFAFCRPDRAIALARALHGKKHLIFGNHDHHRLRDDAAFLSCWVWAKDFAQLKLNGEKISLLHYAMLTWPSSHHGAWQLHGHSHGSLKPDPRARRVDVGVDCWNYQPVAFETLKDVMSTKKWVPIDHHGEE